MTRTRILLLTGAALTTAGVILFRRWNRQLEAACALPVYRRHPSIPGSLYMPSEEEVRRGYDALIRYVHAENERQAGLDFFKRWVDPR